ncbi:MAG: Bifunctional protein HldE [Bacteroidetes bacterium ADurb.Bin408]|nr:MAG: Bifunctional protein HldE [Bacteroidetes bacterium ADurb.Bin408]
MCDGLKTELSFNDMPSLIKTLTAFQMAQGITTVLLSMSENGVLVSEMKGDSQQTFHIPAHLRTIADVSGAGDTLISVAALGIALKLDARTVASLSNLAGGVVCEYVGVVPVDKNRLFDEASKLLIKE